MTTFCFGVQYSRPVDSQCPQRGVPGWMKKIHPECAIVSNPDPYSLGQESQQGRKKRRTSMLRTWKGSPQGWRLFLKLERS
jgi:hypothetical protein